MNFLLKGIKNCLGCIPRLIFFAAAEQAYCSIFFSVLFCSIRKSHLRYRKLVRVLGLISIENPGSRGAIYLPSIILQGEIKCSCR